MPPGTMSTYNPPFGQSSVQAIREDSTNMFCGIVDVRQKNRSRAHKHIMLRNDEQHTLCFPQNAPTFM